MTVLNYDVMAEVIPYVDDPTPTSVTTPALVGIEIDGTPRYERLDSHQRDIGSTRSGKSSLLHLKLAHLTRCEDAIVWIGDRKSTRLNSSHVAISYAVFCLKKKNKK